MSFECKSPKCQRVSAAILKIDLIVDKSDNEDNQEENERSEKDEEEKSEKDEKEKMFVLKEKYFIFEVV